MINRQERLRNGHSGTDKRMDLHMRGGMQTEVEEIIQAKV